MAREGQESQIRLVKLAQSLTHYSLPLAALLGAKQGIFSFIV